MVKDAGKGRIGGSVFTNDVKDIWTGVRDTMNSGWASGTDAHVSWTEGGRDRISNGIK